MLFAVEGGGFFSSSASGYSKGLALLLLGQRNEEKPIRISSWTQYQLVGPGVEPEKPVSRKKRAPCRCTSFICFGCKSGGLDGGFSTPKVSSVQKSETSPESSDSSDRDRVRNSDSADESDVKVFLKSSLKKSSSDCSMIVVKGDDSCDSSEKVESNISYADRRKIQWTDACGMELAQIREFEPSERGPSDDEFEHEGARRCQCVIQ